MGSNPIFPTNINKMDLSNNLKYKIESLLEGYKLSTLKEVSFSLIDSYQKDYKEKPHIDNELKAKIYAVTRMPATYKVASEVFTNIFNFYHNDINSALDIGAGLGAASLALSDLKNVSSFDLYEKEEAMRKLGSYLLEDNKFNYEPYDLTVDEIKNKYDLVISSYVLNELSEEDRKLAIKKMYEASDDLIVIIEPGTPKGHQIIQEVRDMLLAKGAHIIAPCPHEDKCPLKDSDWCHFATRVQRSKFHKLLKDASAPFEDEKYSYIAFTKHELNRCNNRIIRHPQISPSLVKLGVCNSNGFNKVEIRKNDPLYKKVKKLHSGDNF